MFSFISRYALTGALIISGLLGGWAAWQTHELNSAKEVIQGLVEWQDGIVQTTRLAAGSDEVTKDTARSQIQSLGNTRVALENSISNQNLRIKLLEQRTADAKAVADREAQARSAAITRADTLNAQLVDLSKNSVPKDKMEETIRWYQDQVFEAGL